MPTYSTTNLGPYFTQSGGQQPQGGGGGSKESFVVNVNDLGPALNPSETILQMGGGYVGAPTNIMSPDSGYGGAGIQNVNAVNPSMWEQIQFWISQNPIPAIGIGIFGLILLKGGGGGRRR